MTKTSEFGAGFVYNLVLFHKHVGHLQTQLEMYRKMEKEHPGLFGDEQALSLWFNGSSDHFYELKVPKQWKKTDIGKLATWIAERSLHYGHGFKDNPTLEQTQEIIDAVEKLAMLIDKELGVKVVKATYN